MKVRYQYRIYPTPQQVKGLNQLLGVVELCTTTRWRLCGQCRRARNGPAMLNCKSW
nr:helix-turn-helix domain-containing protein [Prochlorothrix hollandica]